MATESTGKRLSEPLPHQSTEQDQAVASYLRTLDTIMDESPLHYRGMTDMLIQHGRFWTVQEYPNALPTMPKKQCFENSYQFSHHYGFRYVEGIALGVIPVHHAWLVDDEDRVIDPTWATISKSVRMPNEINGGIGTSYYGIHFPMDIVRAHRIIVDNMLIGSVLNNHANGYAIYRQPLSFQMIKSGAVTFSVVEGGEIYDEQDFTQAIRRIKRRRKTVQIPRQESLASDSGVSHRRRTRRA